MVKVRDQDLEAMNLKNIGDRVSEKIRLEAKLIQI